MALAAQTRTAQSADWRQWAGRVATAVATCWHRIRALFVGGTPAVVDRAAEKQRRKDIRRQLKLGKRPA
jgi:glutathione S-transferase